MVKKYAQIQKGKILKFKNVSDDDTLAITKMVAHGYIPVVEGALPMFDYITQSLSDTYEISADKVTRKWALQEQQFSEAKKMKEEEIKSKALDHIRAAFDSDSGDSQIAGTLATKKGEFMTALSTAKSNEDLRNITVKYEILATSEKKIGVM